LGGIELANVQPPAALDADDAEAPEALVPGDDEAGVVDGAAFNNIIDFLEPVEHAAPIVSSNSKDQCRRIATHGGDEMRVWRYLLICVVVLLRERGRWFYWIHDEGTFLHMQ
jgi:hypothetical protein